MLHIRAIFIGILLYSAVPGAVAANSTVDFGQFALELPDGYEDRPARGIDSAVGEIVVVGKSFQFHYDSITWGKGPTKLSEFPKGTLDTIIYYEALEDSSVPACIIGYADLRDPKNIYVSLEILGANAQFSVVLPNKADLQQAVATLRMIKVSKILSHPQIR